ncbi:MAG: hypothetical protein ACFCU7_00215 [Pleurocapsa sp.]
MGNECALPRAISYTLPVCFQSCDRFIYNMDMDTEAYILADSTEVFM